MPRPDPIHTLVRPRRVAALVALALSTSPSLARANDRPVAPPVAPTSNTAPLRLRAPWFRTSLPSFKRTPAYGYEVQFYTTVLALPSGIVMTAIGGGMMLDQLEASAHPDRTQFEAGTLVFAVGVVGMIVGSFSLYGYLAHPDPPNIHRRHRVAGFGIGPTARGDGVTCSVAFTL